METADRQLRYFVKIAELKSLSRAGDALDLTQSGISRQLEALGPFLDRLYGQQDDKDPVAIVRAKRQARDAATHPSLVAGLAPDCIMRAFIVRPTKTAKRGRIMSHHEGEEILFILTGKIELLIGKRKEVLYPGDCVQFDSTIPHKLTALSSEAASALVVIATKKN